MYRNAEFCMEDPLPQVVPGSFLRQKRLIDKIGHELIETKEMPQKRGITMKKAGVLFISLFLFACAAGPVYMAKTEAEGIKSSYQESRLQVLRDKNMGLLSQIYGRYNRSRVDVYPEGIGFTLLIGPKEKSCTTSW